MQVRLGQIGFGAQRRSEAVGGGRDATLFPQHLAEVAVGARIVRPQLDGSS
jgi:hypothetical protein